MFSSKILETVNYTRDNSQEGLGASVRDIRHGEHKKSKLVPENVQLVGMSGPREPAGCREEIAGSVTLAKSSRSAGRSGIPGY